MNKHDEIVARWKAHKITVGEIDSALGLLQAYGDALELTKKNLEVWSKGASQQKLISMYNAEIVYLRKILDARDTIEGNSDEL